MKYKITVLEGNKSFPYKKLHYVFNEDEFIRLKKDVKKVNYDKSFEMVNGDIVEWEIIGETNGF